MGNTGLFYDAANRKGLTDLSVECCLFYFFSYLIGRNFCR